MKLDRVAIRILDLDLRAARTASTSFLNTVSMRLSASMWADRSSTYRTIRFHPPGAWRRPSGIGREPELPGPLSNSRSGPRVTDANAGPLRCSS
jgi:hypothetical protein